MPKIRKAPAVYWKINWLRRSIKSVLAIVILLGLLPIALQLAATHQLKRMGADSASIDDIDLNLFAGSFTLSQLSFSADQGEPARLRELAFDIDMLALFSRIIQIDHVRVHGLDSNVVRHKNGAISINGLTVYQPSASAASDADASAEPAAMPGFVVREIRIGDSDIGYQETGLSQRLVISSLALRDLNSLQTDQPARFEATLTVNESAISIDAGALLFKPSKKLDGRLEITGLMVQDYAKFYTDHIPSLQASIDLASDFEIEMTDALSMTLDSSLTVRGLAAEYRNLRQTLERAHWNGSTRLQADGSLSLSGDLALTGSRSLDTGQQYTVAAFEQLDLKGLSHEATATRIGQIMISGLKLVSDGESLPTHQQRLLGVERTVIGELAFKPQDSRLDIQRIDLAAPVASVLLKQDRQLAHLDHLFKTIDGLAPADDAATPESAASPATEQQAGFSFVIGQLQLQSPGHIDIEDNAVSPPYKTRLHLNRIDISNIASQQAATLDLGFRLGDYTGIDVSGQGLLLDPLRSMQLEASIAQLDLPPVTPYTSNAMGYGMKSGTIDTQVKVKLDQREIDSLIDLKIDSIEVVETHAETAEQITSASGMSIDLAVSSLKDKHDVIELKIPVKGNVDQPDFDLSHVINDAMGKAMKAATLSYLKYSLQPFGSLVTLFNLAQAAANHISLPPVLFKVNSVELDDQQQELLDKIVKVMQERPGLKIKACGISNQADREAIEAELIRQETARLAEQAANKKADQKPPKEETAKPPVIEIPAQTVTHQARELADKRSARVKQIILEQGDLEPKRILNCLSSVKTDTDARPSVELSL